MLILLLIFIFPSHFTLFSPNNKEQDDFLSEEHQVKLQFCPQVFCISLGILYHILISLRQIVKANFQDFLLLFKSSSLTMIYFRLKFPSCFISSHKSYQTARLLFQEVAKFYLDRTDCTVFGIRLNILLFSPGLFRFI